MVATAARLTMLVSRLALTLNFLISNVFSNRPAHVNHTMQSARATSAVQELCTASTALCLCVPPARSCGAQATHQSSMMTHHVRFSCSFEASGCHHAKQAFSRAVPLPLALNRS